MKKLYSFVTIGILAFAAEGGLYAQPVGGATYIGDLSSMSSKSAMDKEMRNGNWVYRLNNLKNSKTTFSLTMKDKSVKQVKSKIYADSVRNNAYLVFEDPNNPGQKQKIYCDETIAISKINGDQATPGIATDSCWLFKVEAGKINVYSFFPSADGPFSLMAIQFGSGPIESFNQPSLELLIKDDTKAYKAFLNDDYIKAIKKYNESHQ